MADTEKYMYKIAQYLAMVGGNERDVVRKSADAIKEALEEDGILRIDFESLYQKRRFKEGLKYPRPYTEVALEPSYKKDISNRKGASNIEAYTF